jgi:adenylate kinase
MRQMYVILLGAPGAGKGTQAVQVAEQANLIHIASGDLFRQVRESDSELGRLVKSYYDKGELVPDDVVIRMILDRLQHEDCEDGCILDGFPRTLPQAEALDRALEEDDRQVDRVISIDVSDPELLRRLGGRWLCKACGRSYHVVSAPEKVRGICDACGGQLYQRPDDTEETARKRLQVYFEQTLPLAAYYEKQGKLVQVNGEQPVPAVTKDILEALKPTPLSEAPAVEAGR